MSQRVSVAVIDALKPRVAMCVADACQCLEAYHDLDAHREASESRGNHALQGTAKESALTPSTIPPSDSSSLLSPLGENPKLQHYHDPKAVDLPDETLVQPSWQALEGALVTFRGCA